MDWRKFIIALLCIVGAFVLYYKHIDGGGTFLTLLGGSPLAAEAGRKALEAAVKIGPSADPPDPPAPDSPAAPPGP